jgi:hypothetical protein
LPKKDKNKEKRSPVPFFFVDRHWKPLEADRRQSKIERPIGQKGWYGISLYSEHVTRAFGLKALRPRDLT